MKRKLHVVAGLLFLTALLYDLFLWGGLARSPGLGPPVMEAARREVSLAGFYLPLGKRAVELAGVGDAAVDLAASQFGALEHRLLQNRPALLDTLLSSLPIGVAIGYYGAPLLLLAFAFLWWRRPRVVHSMGGR